MSVEHGIKESYSVQTNSGEDREIWRVDDLLVDVDSGSVERNGEQLQLTGLTFDLLVALVRDAPKYLSQDELVEAVWQGRTVAPETIVQRVKLLRDVLGDDAENPKYVGLVRGRGYKLLPASQRMTSVANESAAFRFGIRHSLLLGIMGLALSLLLFVSAEKPDNPSQPLRAGIAVLPFSSQGTVSEGGNFFAAGVHDDIITELAGIDGLLVISRTSVLAYQDVQRPIGDIGRELNVDRILEGNVQRTADKVKINVQLIDAQADRHLWAQGYERDLNVASVIDTQRQIAVDVAKALSLSLSATRPEKAVSTENMQAYDHYLAARQLVNVAANALQQPDTIFQAAEPLDSATDQLLAAIAEDSDFVEAHALLSTVYSIAYRSAIDRDQALLNRAAATLLEATRRDPNLPMVHLALSEYYFNVGEHKESWAQLEQASKGLPQDTGLLMALAMRTLMAGRADEAKSLIDAVVAQDPLNTRAASMLITIRCFSGDMQGMLAAIRRAQALSPGNVSVAYQGATFSFAATGDLPAYRKAIEKLPTRDPQGVRAHWEVAFMTRDFDAALAVLQAGPGIPWSTLADYTPASYLRGLTRLLGANYRGAEEDMRQARGELETLRDSDPTDPRVLGRLAGAYAVLGEQQMARDAVQAAMDSKRYQRNTMFARIWRRMLIEALILNGDTDGALDLLDLHSRSPGSLPIVSLVMRPTFDRIRTHPRFLEIVRQSSNPIASS